jgi:undecaprenyl-phosphate 4-deoxy-4-formamido-L-arabinose transferase
MQNSLPHPPSERRLEPGISVVIPTYNSQASLPLLIERLGPVLRGLARRYEAILVNDGSRDKTWAAIQALAQRHAWVRGIRLRRNYGQHNATLCGVRLARYDVTVTMDDDLQHPPEEIPHLVEALRRGFDVVYGTPREEQHGVWRDLASQVTKLVLHSAMGAQTARRVSAFRAFRTDVRDGFAGAQGPFIALDVLLTWGTNQFTWVAVQHDPRPVGGSNYTVLKLLTHAANMMTGFSTLPLQFASLVGFASTAFGIVVLAIVLGHYLVHGGQVPGFSFIASTIAIFSGAQLFALGIFGEYLARVHARTTDRPAYAIRETTDRLNAVRRSRAERRKAA